MRVRVVCVSVKRGLKGRGVMSVRMGFRRIFPIVKVGGVAFCLMVIWIECTCNPNGSMSKGNDTCVSFDGASQCRCLPGYTGEGCYTCANTAWEASPGICKGMYSSVIERHDDV